jgi:hypothetical protein
VNIIKIISSAFDSGRRLVKFNRLGRSDVKEKIEVSPYGLDSNPVKDTVGIYTPTSVSGKGVVFGYVNPEQKADVGEFRTYATDSDGVEVFYTWLKNNGTAEIGGDSDFMVRYSELETAFNELRDDFNALVNVYNAHIHTTTATVGLGPVGVISTSPSQGQQSTADISGAKIDEIKTI